jgi:hypothetical protein
MTEQCKCGDSCWAEDQGPCEGELKAVDSFLFGFRFHFCERHGEPPISEHYNRAGWQETSI